MDIKINSLDEKVLSSSATLYKGETNLGVNYISSYYPHIIENKFLLNYCEFYGYKKNKASIPSNLENLNKNDLKLNDNRPKNIPILVERNLENQNIIYYNKRLYSIPERINFNKILKYLKYLRNFKSYEGAKFECYNKNLIKSIKFKIIKLIYVALEFFKKQPKKIKPIVVGHPRTGFTLLISIITEILSIDNQIKKKINIMIL